MNRDALMMADTVAGFLAPAKRLSKREESRCEEVQVSQLFWCWLLSLLARHTNRVYIWTHYYDHEILQASPLNYRYTPPEIGLEISVMGPILRVNDVDEIVCGLDGLIVSHGHRAGLLLPQVAVEYGWDRNTFLSQTCAKAGLEPDAWRSAVVRIDRFRAHVFGE